MNGNSALAVDQTLPLASMTPGQISDPQLSAEELALFARFGLPRRCDPGAVLFHRGTPGQTMYVIVSGMVELDFGEELLPRYLGPSEFFGELELLIADHMRLADARANSAAELLEINSFQFKQMLDQAPALVSSFLRRSLLRVTGNEAALIRQLRRRNAELEAALSNLSHATSKLNHTEELVRTDELTGICNRRGLTLFLQACRNQGRRPPQGLLLIDCDLFKQINDVFGHMAGDHVLQSVANVLRSIATADDLAVRLGGDEFCLVVGETDRRALQGRADFILGAMRGLMERPSQVPRACPVSIGAALLMPSDDWNHWYAIADSALYKAKEAGGNQVVWHDYDAPFVEGGLQLPQRQCDAADPDRGEGE